MIWGARVGQKGVAEDDIRARGCRCLVTNKARRRHVKEIKDCRPERVGLGYTGPSSRTECSVGDGDDDANIKCEGSAARQAAGDGSQQPLAHEFVPFVVD